MIDPARVSTLLGFARLSFLAYGDGDLVREHLGLAVSDTVRLLPEPAPLIFDIKETQGFALRAVVRGAPANIIAFRGTETDKIRDIRTDARFKLQPFLHAAGAALRPQKAHRGFSDAFALADAATRPWIDEKIPVYITGHSLGAALATLAAAARPALASSSVSLVTFGSPRVGDRGLARQLNDKLHDGVHDRVVNNNDIVAAIPLRGIGRFGYHHTGRRVYITHRGDIRADASARHRLADKIRGRVAALRKGEPFDGLRDHDPGRYVRKLAVLADLAPGPLPAAGVRGVHKTHPLEWRCAGDSTPRYHRWINYISDRIAGRPHTLAEHHKLFLDERGLLPPSP